ncbi:MAG TPA: hypothetical protein VEX18_08570, partial [Polyangiaceae bacterium]|nr:hypothetical protein [Polyangiaceae bacterium]
SAPEAMKMIGRALGSDDPPGFIYDLKRSLGLATSLGTLGVAAGALQSIADEALDRPYPNPRAVDRASLLALLDDALHDRRPSRPGYR